MESLNILIVDDGALFRYTLRHILEEIPGVKVIGEAGDGQSAIELALHLSPEVILMDVNMPRLGGVEATRRIKRVLPEVSIIGVSSHDDTGTREAMKAAGCTAYVTKEVAHTLPNIISRITGRQVFEASF